MAFSELWLALLDLSGDFSGLSRLDLIDRLGFAGLANTGALVAFSSWGFGALSSRTLVDFSALGVPGCLSSATKSTQSKNYTDVHV